MIQGKRRVAPFSPHSVTRKLRNVWMVSYEYSGIAQAGGLGEAVGGLARTLASDYGLNVTVFLPGHGRHLDPTVVRRFDLQEIRTFAASGFRTGVNGVHYNFLSGVEKGVDKKVNVVLVKGLDDPTSHWLDDSVLYDQELTFEKMALFSRTLTRYSEYLLAIGRRSEIPDLIHANDWHMVPAGVAVRQYFQEKGLTVPLIFSIHLLSGAMLPWHYASEDWAGIRNLKHQVRITDDRLSSLTHRQVWEDYAGNSIEKFGAIEADYVTSVSESYLTSDVRNYVGETIVGKSGYIYNGCDWDYDRTRSSAVLQEAEAVGERKGEDTAQRWSLRRSLLVKDLATLDPLVNASDSGPSRKTVRGSDSFAFESDGPLVLMTGRLSPQKGADLLLDAVPLVLESVSNAKFLLFLLPSNDSALTEDVATRAAAYPENVRLFFGRSPSLYLQSHIAADVYAMPSRSEPFGISALEAMITGNPVVGSDLGGISETVLDLLSNGQKGTGILVPPENVARLAISLVSLLLVMSIDEQRKKGQSVPSSVVDKIPIEPLSEMVRENPEFGSNIRMNCRARVEQHFRWKNAGKVAMERYALARSLASGSHKS